MKMDTLMYKVYLQFILVTSKYILNIKNVINQDIWSLRIKALIILYTETEIQHFNSLLMYKFIYIYLSIYLSILKHKLDLGPPDIIYIVWEN